MERVKFVIHKNREILSLDFSDCRADDVFRIIGDAKAVIAKQPENSLLTLTNVTNAYFNEKVSDAMKEFTAHNRPFVKAAAVVGITGLRRIVFEAVIRFSRRNLTTFDTVDRAMDWLATQ